MEGSDSEFPKFTVPTLRGQAGQKSYSQNVFGNKQQFVARSRGCQQRISFLLRIRELVVTLSIVLLANAIAAVMAFVLLQNSRFSFIR